jgi:hypothetical protein
MIDEKNQKFLEKTNFELMSETNRMNTVGLSNQIAKTDIVDKISAMIGLMNYAQLVGDKAAVVSIYGKIRSNLSRNEKN